MDKIWDRKSFEARDHYDSYVILHRGEINKTKHVDINKPIQQTQYLQIYITTEHDFLISQ